VAFLYDRSCLFTGDSLAWSFEDDDLTAWPDYCWHSWAEQVKSLGRLLDYPFKWVLAGHGGSKGLPGDEMHKRLAALVARLAQN
jgi:glyoxylase-like metal-dependent hydrolase (beta-lactamase superfamily II)